LSLYQLPQTNGAPKTVRHSSTEIGRNKARKERVGARLRGEIPPWTRECIPKLYHNTPEGKREAARKKREAYLNRPLVPAAVLPSDVSDPRAEEHQLRARRKYVLGGLERGYPLREDPHDCRIFHTPAPLDGFLHIATKYLTPEQLAEAVSRFLVATFDTSQKRKTLSQQQLQFRIQLQRQLREERWSFRSQLHLQRLQRFYVCYKSHKGSKRSWPWLHQRSLKNVLNVLKNVLHSRDDGECH
jgi:hypothetical protein